MTIYEMALKAAKSEYKPFLILAAIALLWAPGCNYIIATDIEFYGIAGMDVIMLWCYRMIYPFVVVLFAVFAVWQKIKFRRIDWAVVFFYSCIWAFFIGYFFYIVLALINIYG